MKPNSTVVASMSQFHSMEIVSLVLLVGSFVSINALLLRVCDDVCNRERVRVGP